MRVILLEIVLIMSQFFPYTSLICGQNDNLNSLRVLGFNFFKVYIGFCLGFSKGRSNYTSWEVRKLALKIMVAALWNVEHLYPLINCWGEVFLSPENVHQVCFLIIECDFLLNFSHVHRSNSEEKLSFQNDSNGSKYMQSLNMRRVNSHEDFSGDVNHNSCRSSQITRADAEHEEKRVSHCMCTFIVADLRGGGDDSRISSP